MKDHKLNNLMFRHSVSRVDFAGFLKKKSNIVVLLPPVGPHSSSISRVLTVSISHIAMTSNPNN